jgi:hypothetical protein
MEKIYYKHIIITSGNQDDVEREINSYIEDACNINIISLNVIPEKVGIENVEGFLVPKYWYHISLTYTIAEMRS